VDDGSPVAVDLLSHASDPRSVSLDELVTAINDALGADVATDDGAHLILVSPTDGAGGSIEVHPLTTTVRRRFLSHALITDDAGTRIFGFTARLATGADPSPARLVGANDLIGGVDLRDRNHLRLRLDGGDAVEIDCAGPRPRATTPDEIVAAINAALGSPVASTDGHVVLLVSPTAGGDSAIVLEPTRARDAVEALGLATGLVRGTDATGVSLTSVVDLSAGVDLPAGAALALGIDGGAPVDVTVGDVDPVHRTLSQIVTIVNATLGAGIASHDGTRLHLTSPTRGAGASIEIATPTTGSDATGQLLGVSPRTYTGAAAAPAEVEGNVDLASTGPLGPRSLLRIGVDGAAPVIVDVAARAAEPLAPTPSEIATAINVASDAVASIIEGRLRVASPTSGSASRIEIDRAATGDARSAIFGAVENEAKGQAAQPAVLTGEADLISPLDLTDGSIVRLAIDGARPVDIDVAGGSPDATVLAEIIAAIDDVLPGGPDATPDDRLRMTSPTAGATSSVELLALRRLEIQEYPPQTRQLDTDLSHGSRFAIDNHGADATTVSVRIDSLAGTVGPKIAALDRPWSVRVAAAVSAGGRVEVTVVDGVVAATITDEAGTRPVPPASILLHGRADHLLRLTRGRNRFAFLECDAARFDDARFDADVFAGGDCTEIGIFDASRFSAAPDIRTAFAGAGHSMPRSRLTARWDEHRAGALVVNLPDRLDERYGARFGEGRLGSVDAETFPGVVTEPFDDPKHVLTAVKAGSALVEAHLVPRVPIGWSAVAPPFRDPQPLTLGTATQEARLYLSEEGLGGDVLELRARHPGTWANSVTVTARTSGPAIYDLEIRYPGGRFENARAVVAGWPPVAATGDRPPAGCAFAPSSRRPSVAGAGADGLPTLASDLLAPGPAGILVAKAAGIHARVTRDRALSA
ncbi:MAG TPA: hypothetical protein VHF25_16035, partial [Nitriliruptorales bacterium]|nr:hypothetical protein [Nitriliruptorales bacterium]